MIFVTVGTTAFEGLIKAADMLKTDEKVIIQKADGRYEPKNHEFLEYTHEFSAFVDKADIIITHGGAGTLFELIEKGKKVVGVANEERDDLHQWDLLKELADNGYIMWCRDLNTLAKDVERARDFEPKKYQKPACTIARSIINYCNN